MRHPETGGPKVQMCETADATRDYQPRSTPALPAYLSVRKTPEGASSTWRLLGRPGANWPRGRFRRRNTGTEIFY